MSPKLFILAFILSFTYGLPTNLLSSFLLPTAEVCVKSDVGYDWHYATKFSPISATLPVGHAVEIADYARGIFAPLSPLFSQLFISLSTAQFNSTEPLRSSTRQVKIQENQRKGYFQYYEELENLIEFEMKSWDYSRRLEDHNTTFVFLPEASSMLTSFHNYQYELDGYGVIRFLSFIFANSPSTPPKFPSLWPWVNAKLNKPKELVIQTDVMVAQELFSITHSPSHLYHNNYDLTNDDAAKNLTNDSQDDNSSEFYTNIIHNKQFIAEHDKYGFVSKIQFGDHLYMSLNVTSLSPPNKPYFAKKLVGGIKDLLLETITPLQFDESYPNVSFNISFTWSPLHTVSNATGKVYSKVENLFGIEATELLDIVTSWRLGIINSDPLDAIPVALQARSVQLITSKSCNYSDQDQLDFEADSLRADKAVQFLTDSALVDDKDEEDLFIATQSVEASEDLRDLNHALPASENELVGDSHNNRGSELDVARTSNQVNRKLKCSSETYITRGEIIQVFTAKCAFGFLPPYSVLEMLWEMNFLIMVIAFCFISLVTYFTMGSLVNQLMLEGQLRLPFFVHLREFPLRLRFLFLWPVGAPQNHNNNANNNENN